MSKHGENIYKRADGRYEGRYIRGRKPDGKAIYGYIYGSKYAEVKKQLTEKRMQYQDFLRDPVPQTPRMRVWAKEWRGDTCSRKLKPSTLQKYDQMLNQHILPYFGMIEIGRIDRQMLLDFVDWLKEKGLADKSIQNILQLMRELLRKAADHDLLRQVPEMKFLLPPAPEYEILVLSQNEENKLMHCAEEKDLAVQLCLYTGLRIGEVCGLQWQDIDEYHQTMTIRRTVLRLNVKEEDHKTALVINAPKTASSFRTIPLPDQLIEKLLMIRNDLFKPEDFIFGKKDKPADPRNIQRRFQRLLQRAELPPIRFHNLRHTFTTRMLELGTDVKTVSAILGHSSVKTTIEIYAHSQMETKRKAIDLLAEQFV